VRYGSTAFPLVQPHRDVVTPGPAGTGTARAPPLAAFTAAAGAAVVVLDARAAAV
jgi:hypothetical protein